MPSGHEARATRQLPLSQRIFGGPPARTLDDAVKLADPFTPLDPNADVAIRADVDRFRGGDRLARIARNIRRSGGIPTLHFLTGHVGSDKTTELLRLKERLTHPDGNMPGNSVVYLDADAMLDRYNVDLEDLVIALWNVIFRDHPAVASKALTPVWKEKIEGVFKTTVVNLPDRVPEAVSTVLGQLKLPGVEERQKVRAVVSSLLGALIQALNKAFLALREGATDNDHAPGDVTAGATVLLIDNLEKVGEGRREAVERLYLERMGALKELDAHLVITAPVYLCYAAAGASLIGLYGGEVVLLPMIKVRKRRDGGEGGDDADGLGAMVELLEKRFDFGALFEGGREAAEIIARRSGGCIRHALHMVQWAANEHDTPPVTKASVEKAARVLQADFDRALPEAWAPVLQFVMENNRFPGDVNDGTKKELLRHLFVLEYQNGEPDPWYAVHPLVETCRKMGLARGAAAT